MRKANLLAGLTALIIGALVGGTPAFAVVNGALDGNNHPSVGFMFAQLTDPATCNAQLVSSCSATLVSPTVAVTSAGCAQAFSVPFESQDITAVWISFNPDNPFDCATASRVGSLQLHPSFDATLAPSPFDIGVAVLSAPAAATPATLPAADSQGEYAKGSPFDVVSFDGITGGNILDYRRRLSPADLFSTDDDFLRIKLSHSATRVCMGGGEGGGVFLPTSQDLSALIINDPKGGCKNAHVLRLDTPTVRDFLGGFVTLP